MTIDRLNKGNSIVFSIEENNKLRTFLLSTDVPQFLVNAANYQDTHYINLYRSLGKIRHDKLLNDIKKSLDERFLELKNELEKL